MENGKYDLGDECRVAISEYDTKEVPDEVLLEAHRNYIDLQMVASGEEAMFTQSIDDGEEKIPYNDVKDVEFFTSSWYNTICLYDGNFALLFPNDLHNGSFEIEKSEKVKMVLERILCIFLLFFKFVTYPVHCFYIRRSITEVSPKHFDMSIHRSAIAEIIKSPNIA